MGLAGLGAVAKLLMVAGVVLLVSGALLYLLGRVPYLGRLPGDFTYHRGGFTLYFPLVTGLVLSLLLTLVLNLLFWRR